jgi:hypothetical protein
MTRFGLVMVWLTLLFSTVAGLFWYNDWVYQLPTPVPLHYIPISTGSPIYLKGKINAPTGKPVFLHFYNPDCPCSRFNKSHFRSLVQSYGNQVHFAVVVMTDKKYSEKDIQDKIGLNLPITFDRSIANQCGVYSTPQAIILDKDQKLFYRGNYNSSRYCTDEKSAYAKIALDGLLKSNTLPDVDPKALTAYGCTLPLCKN